MVLQLSHHPEEKNIIKIVMLGDSEVGKTEICKNGLEFNVDTLNTTGNENSKKEKLQKMEKQLN